MPELWKLTVGHTIIAMCKEHHCIFEDMKVKDPDMATFHIFGTGIKKDQWCQDFRKDYGSSDYEPFAEDDTEKKQASVVISLDNGEFVTVEFIFFDTFDSVEDDD